MSTAQLASNKATFSRFHDATNSGDAELISKTIDEVVEPDVVFHAPVPTGATGGRIAEIWGVVDVLSQMRQLGLNQAEQRPQPGR